MAFIESVILLGTIGALILIWCKWNYSYWTRNGIAQASPVPFIGNIKPFLTFKRSFGLHLSNIYRDKRFANDPVVGIYILNKPGLIIRDLELVKSVLIKDFNKFSNRSSSGDPHGEPLSSYNLFFIRNPYWKELRVKLSPVFTSGKIKTMYPLMLEIANELELHMSRYPRDSNSNFVEEIKEICATFTTDNIATIAFGIRANGLQDRQALFRQICRRQFEFDSNRARVLFTIFFLPKLATFLRLQFFSTEFCKLARDTITHVMDDREQTGNQRNDLIDILLELKKAGTFDFNRDFLMAQGAVFLAAGFESSSSAMSFALYELAKQPDMQARLREEICEALLENNGTIPYEKLYSLEYLGMVVDEILRLYPILPFLDRECANAEGEEPYTLKPHCNYKVPNGMAVYIPIFGIQRDPQYWSDPDTFDPERFSADNKKSRHPMSYIPFGSGPHNCVGMRIGLLQTKLGLVHILKNYSVSPCEKTPKKIEFDPRAFVIQTVEGIHLKISYDQMYNKRAAI